MGSECKKLDDEWRSKYETLERQMGADGEAAAKELAEKWRKEMEDLEERLSGQVSDLENQLEKLRAEKEEQAKSYEEQMKVLRDQAEQALKGGEAERDAALAKVRAEMQEEARKAAAEAAKEAEKNMLEAVAKKGREGDTALVTAKEEHDERMRVRVAELRAEQEALEKRLDEARKEAIDALNAEWEAKMKALLDSHKNDSDAEINKLKAMLEETQKQLTEKTHSHDRLEEELAKATHDLRLKCEELERAVAENEEKYKTTVDRMTRERQEEVNSLVEENMRETRALQQEFQKTSTMMNQQRAELEKQLEESEERYRNRPSRPEDLERIRILDEEMVTKDALVKKTREEMIYFKRELLNREENFNQRFGASPNVGVMQVVKNKNQNMGPKQMAMNSVAKGVKAAGRMQMGVGNGRKSKQGQNRGVENNGLPPLGGIGGSSSAGNAGGMGIGYTKPQRPNNNRRPSR